MSSFTVYFINPLCGLYIPFLLVLIIRKILLRNSPRISYLKQKKAPSKQDAKKYNKPQTVSKSFDQVTTIS